MAVCSHIPTPSLSRFLLNKTRDFQSGSWVEGRDAAVGSSICVGSRCLIASPLLHFSRHDSASLISLSNEL